MKKSLLVLAVLPFLLASCAGKTVSFQLKRDAILDEVGKNTRTQKVYRDLDTIFIADILWNRPEIKKSLVSSLRQEGRVDESQAQKMLDNVAAQEGKELEFMVGLYTSDKAWNDLDKENSMWHLALLAADGSPVVPTKIERIKLATMQDAWLYPFITPWKNAYRVTFPMDPLRGVGAYTLRLSSLVGEGTFVWNLK